MKYEFTKNNITTNDGRVLSQIQAMKTFETYRKDIIREGDLGGWVETPNNLAQDGKCWVYPNARVFGQARVADDAVIYGSARRTAEIGGKTRVLDRAIIHGTRMLGDAKIFCLLALRCVVEWKENLLNRYYA